MSYTNTQLLHAALGGGNGGINIASGVDTAAYDYIIVESGVTLTVLKDDDDNNLLTSKNISGVAFTAERLLGAGEGHTFKKLTFTGGLVWGYTFPTKQI